jgi:hypothetical protein
MTAATLRALHARLNSRMISHNGVNAWSADHTITGILLLNRHHGWGPRELAIISVRVSLAEVAVV